MRRVTISPTSGSVGQLIKVTIRSSKGRPEKSVNYIVAEHDFEKAAAILKPKIPVGAKVESSGNVSESLLRSLKLAPGQFTEV
jgi:hypothetical protein